MTTVSGQTVICHQLILLPQASRPGSEGPVFKEGLLIDSGMLLIFVVDTLLALRATTHKTLSNRVGGLPMW